QDAKWLSTQHELGVDWSGAKRNLWPLIAPIKALGLDATDTLSSHVLISYIAAAERKAGKPLNELATTEEPKVALDAFEESAPDLLFSLWSKTRLDKEQLRLVLLDVWRYTDQPAAWPARWWRRIFSGDRVFERRAATARTSDNGLPWHQAGRT